MHNNAVSFHAPAKQSLRKRVCQRWQLFLFLLIPVAWVLIFCYYPMMGVQIAFKNYLPREGIWGSAWVGLTHFVTFFKSFYFSRTVGNTVRLSLYSLGVGFPLAIIFALMMNLIRRRRFQKAVQTISYMPHFISTVVLVGMMNQILNPVTGLYSNIYRLFNPGEYPIDILSRANAFDHLYVWSGVWQNLGWNTIIYMAALSGVAPELYEAAVIDGANRWQQAWNVTLPSILPTVIVLMILNIQGILNSDTEKILLMYNAQVFETADVIGTYVYREGIESSRFSYSAAVGLMTSALSLLLVVMANKISKTVTEYSLW